MKNMFGDLQIVVERHSDVLRNNALPFRILIGLRIVGFLVSPLSAAFHFLSLTPVQLFSIQIWRLCSCAFVGKNIPLFLWTLSSLRFGVNLIRQANTNEAVLKTFAVTQLLSTAIVSLIALLLYATVGSTYLLYNSPMVDCIAVNAAVLVMVKQFLPDSILLSTPFGRVKYTHLPACAVMSTLLTSLVGITNWVVVLQVLAGIQVSWTYLRFFNPHETDAIFGDSSDHFTWASLFPRRIQPICTILGRICFRSLVKLGVCKRQIRHVDLNSLQTVPISLSGLDSTAKDAERRRQKALRDLNERLNKTKTMEPSIEWDEDIDKDEEIRNIGTEGAQVPDENRPTTSQPADATSESHGI